MDPVDGAFNDAAEEVTAALGPFIDPSVMDVCVRGVDARGNMGLPSCVMIAVFDPTGGFATGAGWIESPRGAFVSAGDLVGKAHFAFVSKYAKGKTIPDGNASFRFKLAAFEFESTSYDWLVVNQGGSNAQFKGSGTVNGDKAPTGENYRFMIWQATTPTTRFA